MRFAYYSSGKLTHVDLISAAGVAELQPHPPEEGCSAPLPRNALDSSRSIGASLQKFRSIDTGFHRDYSIEGSPFAIKTRGDSIVIPTQTIVVEGAKKAEIRRLHSKFGMEVIREGSNGKLLLRAPEGGIEGVQSHS